jgi:hypothetical protein
MCILMVLVLVVLVLVLRRVGKCLRFYFEGGCRIWVGSGLNELEGLWAFI